jgi:hypothetical protein
LFPVKPADVECYALYVYVEIVILTDEKWAWYDLTVLKRITLIEIATAAFCPEWQYEMSSDKPNKGTVVSFKWCSEYYFLRKNKVIKWMMRQLWQGDSWMSRQQDVSKFYIIPTFQRCSYHSTFKVPSYFILEV